MTPDAMDALFRKADGLITNRGLTAAQHENIRLFRNAYRSYLHSNGKGDLAHLSCHQDALATYEAARVTIAQLEADAPPVAGSPDPLVVTPEPATSIVVAPAAESDAEEQIVWIDRGLGPA